MYTFLKNSVTNFLYRDNFILHERKFLYFQAASFLIDRNKNCFTQPLLSLFFIYIQNACQVKKLFKMGGFHTFYFEATSVLWHISILLVNHRLRYFFRLFVEWFIATDFFFVLQTHIKHNKIYYYFLLL